MNAGPSLLREANAHLLESVALRDAVLGEALNQEKAGQVHETSDEFDRGARGVILLFEERGQSLAEEVGVAVRVARPGGHEFDRLPAVPGLARIQ